MPEIVTLATKLTKEEAKMVEEITKDYGFMNKSETVRSAIRLYVNLMSLPSSERLRMLRIINELVAPSNRTSGELVEGVHAEEDAE